MRPEGGGSPARVWLARAKSNMALANTKDREGVFLEELCFNAQQASEKALKAVLQFKGIPFRYVHDLEELITALERNQVSVPADLKAAAALTEYAVELRYPGTYEPVTETEYQQAIEMAGRIIRWAEGIIDGSD